jgi:phosphoribosylanthranilate isomerase
VRTRIKICGITRLEDALDAARLGADALGFIFAPSPRQAGVDEAARICARLPPHVDRVGVFADQSREEILAVCDRVHLTRIQLHGSERPEHAAGLPGALTRSLDLSSPDLEAHWNAWSGCRPDVQFLADLTKNSAAEPPGRFWTRVAALPAECRRGLTLAGGLHPGNVQEALEVVDPIAVDVARGVEARPGIKDRTLLGSFFAAVAEFDRRRGRDAGP